MKKLLCLSLVLGFCLFGTEGCKGKKAKKDNPLSMSRGTPKHKRKKTLVMPILNKSNLGGETLAEQSLETIEKWMELHDEFIYVPVEEVDPEKNFLTEDGNYDIPAIFDSTSDKGISALLLTEIEDIEVSEDGDKQGFFRNRETTTAARVRIRVYDLTTQKEILSKRKVGKYKEEDIQLLGGGGDPVYDSDHGKGAVAKGILHILDLLPKYAKRIDWSGQIAKIENARFYIDAGRVTGLNRGQILEVYGIEKRVPNKVTGKPLGYFRGRFKGTLKIYDFVGDDAAIAMAHSGEGFKELDRVELFLPRHK